MGETDCSAFVGARRLVGWGDVDPTGIAYYPRFFEWMDVASHALAREMGIHPDEMIPPSRRGFPIVSARAEFVHPARYGDEVEVRTRVTRISDRSFSLRHEIYRLGEPAVLLARGDEDHVHIAGHVSDPIKARPLTDAMRSVLQRYLAVESA